MLTRYACVLGGLILVATMLLSCHTHSGRTDDHAAQNPDHSSASSSTAMRVVSVPPPPGLEAKQVQPHVGKPMEKARLSQSEILSQLPTPSYLHAKKHLTEKRSTGPKPHSGGAEQVAVTTQPRPQADEQASSQEQAAADPNEPDTASTASSATPDRLSSAHAQTGDLESQPDPPLAAQHDYLKARLAWRQGQSFNAIRHLQSALRLAPDSPQILRLLGMIYTRSGNKVRGARYLEKTVRLDPQDVESLYLLGRHALSQKRGTEAIVTLSRAYELNQSVDNSDPTFQPLMQYLLGSALAQSGYDAAAIDQYRECVNKMSARLSRTTRMVRELMILSQQRGSIWRRIGDAHHRLDQPHEALQAYGNAMQYTDAADHGLLYRLIYSELRLGQVQQAQQLAIEYMRLHGADDVTLRLVRYLAEHADHEGELVALLRGLYEQDDRPGSLAIVIGDLTDDPAVVRFLVAHLEAKPDDRAVFAYLINRLCTPPQATVESVQLALQTTIQAVHQLPQAMGKYATILVETTGQPKLLLGVIQELDDPQLTRRAVVRLIRGLALARDGQTQAATTELEQVVAEVPGLTEAKIELAKMWSSQNDVERALNLLNSLDRATQIDPQVVQLHVSLLRHMGRLDDAMRLVDQALQRDPSSTPIAIEKAQLHLLQGDVNAAESALLQVLEKQPHDEVIYEKLIHLYQSARIDDVGQKYRQLLRKMRSTIPYSRIARLEHAKNLLANQQLDDAESLLGDLLQENPHDQDALTLLLTLLTKADRQHEARELLENRLKNTPDDVHLLSLALQHYHRVEDHPGVVETGHRLLTLLLAKESKDLRSIDTLLQWVSQAGGNDAIDQLLDKQLAPDSVDRGLLVVAQRHYERIQDRPRLMRSTERLLLTQPPSASRTLNLAALYLRHGRAQEAIGLLTEAMQVEPSDAQPLVDAPEDQPQPDDHNARLMVGLLARAFTQTGQPDRADEALQQAIERFPDQATDIRFDWAMLCERRGEKERSHQMLLSLLKEHPDHLLANNALGYGWADQGKNLEQAQAMIRKAVDAEPNNAAYLDSMGWVLYKLGQFQEAVTWLRRARVAPGGEYPVILDHLGDALYRDEQIKQARAAWGDALTGFDQLDISQTQDDPELAGLKSRLRDKLKSVNESLPPDLAPVPDAPDMDAPSDPASDQPDEDSPSLPGDKPASNQPSPTPDPIAQPQNP